MSAHRSKHLLAILLAILAARGLAPEALEPWRGWVALKQFAREVAESPDPGVSVQIAPLGTGLPVRLFFLRQVTVAEEGRLEPVGGVVCELCFAPSRRMPREWEAWSFDFPDFERFVDIVEQHPPLADLLVTRPLASAVYWEDA